GANVDALDAGGLYRVGQLFDNFLVDLDDDVAFVIFNFLERNAAHNAVAQRLDFDSGFQNRLDVNSVGRAAIEFVDDYVLGYVNQAPREIAGIGGLKRRIGQTFTRSVRGDEVLQHGEAFAEVRSDRSLDDFARGLGHQAAHSGKLADLLFRTARAGIGHHVHRIDHALLVLLFERFKHFVRHFFGDVRPDGDHLVVAFSVGDCAIQILLLNFHHFVLGSVHQLEFHAGNDHVADADGDAGLRCIQKAELLQLIERDHGLFQAEAQ